jgi:hypothetical protein
MIKDAEDNSSLEQSEDSAHRLRIPRSIKDEDLGLGDAIARSAFYLGVKPCGAVSAVPLRSIAGWFSPADFRGRG